jgi:hypothetical protein
MQLTASPERLEPDKAEISVYCNNECSRQERIQKDTMERIPLTYRVLDAVTLQNTFAYYCGSRGRGFETLCSPQNFLRKRPLHRWP